MSANDPANGNPMQESNRHTVGSWFVASREHYLAFLRNITPQALLASLAWVLALKLDFTQPDLRNWLPTVGFFIYLGAFAWSFWASTTLFLENSFPDFSAWRRNEENRLRDSGSKGASFLTSFVRLVLKQRPAEATLSIALLVFLPFALAAIVVTSMVATVNFIRATH